MFKREKFFVTVLMIFAAASLGGVTLSFRTQLYSRLFAALPLVFLGSVTAIYSSKKELGSLNEICAPANEIIDSDEIISLNDKEDITIPGVSVLIVSPTEADLELVRDMLRPYGMRMDCVDSGEWAAELVAADDLTYGAVFIDFAMPLIELYETVDMIRGIATDYARSVPIIALSSDEAIGEDVSVAEKEFHSFAAISACAGELSDIINSLVGEAESV